MNGFGKKSILISKILCYIIYAAITLATVGIPFFVKLIFGSIGAEALIPKATAMLYFSLPPALTATVFLHRLLVNISAENIFTEENIRIIGILAVCCAFVGVLYLAFTFAFRTMILVSFAAFFFCVMLTVIRSVFCAAYLIKQENDLTV